jgi:hypothetical protein
MRLFPLAFLLTASAFAGSGCRNHDDAKSSEIHVSFGRPVDSASANPTLRDGDIRIVSTDSGVDMALIGDTISAGLSQQALAKVRRETDTSAVKGDGFGASIEKMVKGTVQSAIGTRAKFPLSSVQDVRYEGGKLVFVWNGKPQNVLGHTKVNDKDMLQAFSPEDAQRFVDAVRARKHTQIQS